MGAQQFQTAMDKERNGLKDKNEKMININNLVRIEKKKPTIFEALRSNTTSNNSIHNNV